MLRPIFEYRIKATSLPTWCKARMTCLMHSNWCAKLRKGWRPRRFDNAEQLTFARATIALRYENADAATRAAPITESQLLAPRRSDDAHDDIGNSCRDAAMQGGRRLPGIESVPHMHVSPAWR